METIQKALDLMESNKSDEALNILQSFLPKASDDQKFTIAELYMQWGFFIEARIILEELLQAYPEETDIYIILADIYIELDQDQKAIQILANIDKKDNAYPQALLQLADLYQSQGLFEVAEMKLLEAKKIIPGEFVIDFALGEFYFSTGEYEKAILYYEKLNDQIEGMTEVSIVERLAESYAAIGKFEKAIDLFQSLETKEPDFLFKFGLTAIQANRNDIAINAWNEVIKLDPSYHTVYHELAKVYRHEGMLNEAYDIIQIGLKKDEFNKEIFYYAAVLANELNRIDESENYVRQAIVLDTDYKEAILFLIELFKTQGNEEEIIKLIKEIKEMGSYDGAYEWELAKAYVEMELYQEALSAYKEAYLTLNEDSDFLKEYGYYLTEEGEINKAIQVLKSYLDLVPADIEIESFINRLKQSNE